MPLKIKFIRFRASFTERMICRLLASYLDILSVLQKKVQKINF
jgi:hypothetical protein